MRRRIDASIPPKTIGTSGYRLFNILEYTIVGYSGRQSCRPSGLYSSTERSLRFAVYLLTIESIQPGEIPKNNRGRPNFLKSR